LSLLSSLLKDLLVRRNEPGSSPTQTAHTPDSFYDSGKKSLDSGDISAAQATYSEFLRAFPDHPMLKDLQAYTHHVVLQKHFPGPIYLDWLNWFQASLKPGNYVEIGVENGKSLQYARPPTRAIGIDPAIAIAYSQETWVKLFKLPSDDFFQQHNLRDVLGSEHVDLAFIDGLHTFDQALKDFINIERYCTPTSVVLFHDILPVIPVTALRERETTFWLGDTWKAIAILLKYRPDLKVFTIPAYPSGLTVVTNLDAGNSTLHRNFESIFQEMMALDVESCLPTMDTRLNVVSNDFDVVKRLLETAKL
jgi:hypothetical protein